MHTIYKTTNNINGKIYIGKHTANNPYDEYLGSGHGLKAAIKKYGKSNFTKEVLYVFDDEQSMIDKEIELVNEDFVARSDTYNRTLGGLGSFYHINSQRTEGAFKGKKHSTESKIKMSRVQKSVQNLPHNRERNSRNQQIAQNRPEVREAKSSRTKSYMADPIIKYKHKQACNTPEFKAAQSAKNLGKTWVTDGVSQTYISPEQVDEYLSRGWHLGMRPRKRTDIVS